MELTVYGTPVPKGSARAFAIPGKDGQRPRAVVVSDNKKPLAHWQTQIANEARLMKGSRPGDVPAFDGAIGVYVAFHFNRPKSVSKTSRPYVTVKPDLDKLVRAVLDGLTGVIWRDDAQVTDLRAEKSYLDVAGAEHAVILIWDVKP
jgi:Holliday junction resolvase RusA-like endonuclease